MSDAEGRAEELTEQRQRILHFPVKFKKKKNKDQRDENVNIPAR